MNFKSFIANSAESHVSYLGSVLISVSQSIRPIIIVSRDWLSWLAADDEISAHRQWLGGVGGGTGCVSPSQWHWMIRRVRGRGRRNILLSGEYLGVLFVFRESLTASYERVHSVKPMYHGTTAISELHKKLNINHWTNPLLTNINLILATEFY